MGHLPIRGVLKLSLEPRLKTAYIIQVHSSFPSLWHAFLTMAMDWTVYLYFQRYSSRDKRWRSTGGGFYDAPFPLFQRSGPPAEKAEHGLGRLLESDRLEHSARQSVPRQRHIRRRQANIPLSQSRWGADLVLPLEFPLCSARPYRLTLPSCCWFDSLQ